MNTNAPDVATTAVAPRPEVLAQIAEKVLLGGDLSAMNPTERVTYYLKTCDTLGLNPYTKPFDYIETDQGLKLYPNKDCAAQLRAKHNVSLRIVAREVQGQIFVVTTQASMPDGRTDESVGAVPMVKELGEWKTSQNGKKYFVPSGQIKPLSPESQANAVMRAETKAKRRATLSICGLGMLDAPDSVEDDAPRWEFDLGTGTVSAPASPSEPQSQGRTESVPTEPVTTGDPELDRELLQFSRMTREQRLAKFAELKRGLQEQHGEDGTVTYYQILKEQGEGAEHAWQLSNMRQAKAALMAMWRILREGVPVEEPTL